MATITAIERALSEGRFNETMLRELVSVGLALPDGFLASEENWIAEWLPERMGAIAAQVPNALAILEPLIGYSTRFRHRIVTRPECVCALAPGNDWPHFVERLVRKCVHNHNWIRVLCAAGFDHSGMKDVIISLLTPLGEREGNCSIAEHFEDFDCFALDDLLEIFEAMATHHPGHFLIRLGTIASCIGRMEEGERWAWGRLKEKDWTNEWVLLLSKTAVDRLAGASLPYNFTLGVLHRLPLDYQFVAVKHLSFSIPDASYSERNVQAFANDVRHLTYLLKEVGEEKGRTEGVLEKLLSLVDHHSAPFVFRAALETWSDVGEDGICDVDAFLNSWLGRILFTTVGKVGWCLRTVESHTGAKRSSMQVRVTRAVIVKHDDDRFDGLARRTYLSAGERVLTPAQFDDERCHPYTTPGGLKIYTAVLHPLKALPKNW